MKEFLTRWSIKHPVLVAALYIAMVTLSVLVLLGLPVRMMPYVETAGSCHYPSTGDFARGSGSLYY